MLLSDMSPVSKKCQVLVIEDEPIDLALIQQVIETEEIPVHLIPFDNGEGAIQYLEQTSPQAPIPELILLDLKLPGIQGLEILKMIRSDARFCIIPIVILTALESPAVILEAYRLGCNCYIKKPLAPKILAATVMAIFDFWLNFAILPEAEGIAWNHAS